MHVIARQNGIPTQAVNTWQHSAVVWKFAQKISSFAMKNGYKINLTFLKTACYIHDIGRMVTGSKASKKLKPAIGHFYAGYQIINTRGYPKLARICICHAGGTGLDAVTNKKNGFTAMNYFPRTIEEKIIAYADMRTSWKPRTGPYIWSFDEAYKRFKRYEIPGNNRLMKIQRYIQNITNGKIS